MDEPPEYSNKIFIYILLPEATSSSVTSSVHLMYAHEIGQQEQQKFLARFPYFSTSHMLSRSLEVRWRSATWRNSLGLPSSCCGDSGVEVCEGGSHFTLQIKYILKHTCTGTHTCTCTHTCAGTPYFSAHQPEEVLHILTTLTKYVCLKCMCAACTLSGLCVPYKKMC